MRKIIFILFAILLFFIPLILWPFTSEVFEFNKMVLVYTLTVLIVATWLTRSVLVKKFIFHRTILDIPLLIFIGSQVVSTIFSIDPLTSWFGYYSRFNGGLLSTICYSLLYWAFVSNLDRKSALRTLYPVLTSAVIVSVYGILEHFGIDKTIWVQDVQNRVFSTLGQPNWLAAYLVALIPIVWVSVIYNLQFTIYNKFSKSKFINFLIYFSLSILLFWTLIFTKSRSGLFGFGVAFIIFWVFYFWQYRKNQKQIWIPFVIISFSLLAISLISGTQFTPSIKSLLSNQVTNNQVTIPQGPALEIGGTESGTIRKIVWKGALQVWLHYPIFGTGVETFAYSYYKHRPAEHNLVSEWDFIYNKAHNEFLNMAANSGTVGLLSYLFLIGASLYLFIKKLELPITNYQFTIIALLSGYVGLSVTNFFGFSVVPTQLQFFLFPAFAVTLVQESKRVEEYKNRKLAISQKLGILISCSFTLILLYSISKYWLADTLYAKGKTFNSVQKPDSALKYLVKTVSLEPSQALYHNELANSYTFFAQAYHQEKNTNEAREFANLATGESDKAITLSPANLNLKRSRFGIFITLSAIDSNYLIQARDILVDIIKYAPTDAKLRYNLGLVYARTGQGDLALTTLQKTIDLKANYKEARLAYAILLIDKKQNAEAKTQLEYILRNIDPNDTLTRQTLESLK